MINRNKTLILLLIFFIAFNSIYSLTQEQRSNNSPPVIAGIPDIVLDQNSKANQVIDLWKYTSDPDTLVSKLLFSVTSQREFHRQGSAHVKVDLNRYINVSPDQNWTGEEEIIVEANDGTNIAYATFKVILRSTEAGRLIEAEAPGSPPLSGAIVSYPVDTVRCDWGSPARYMFGHR